LAVAVAVVAILAHMERADQAALVLSSSKSHLRIALLFIGCDFKHLAHLSPDTTYTRLLLLLRLPRPLLSLLAHLLLRCWLLQVEAQAVLMGWLAEAVLVDTVQALHYR
jgi:hypothetical protein